MDVNVYRGENPRKNMTGGAQIRVMVDGVWYDTDCYISPQGEERVSIGTIAYQSGNTIPRVWNAPERVHLMALANAAAHLPTMRIPALSATIEDLAASRVGAGVIRSYQRYPREYRLLWAE